jgi:glycosyltransferase involved in cell wall biosynthesis
MADDDARRPLVVLVRPTDVETDSRVKKMAISLTRLGYDTIVLGRSGTGRRRQGRLADARVLLVPPKSRLRGSPARLIRLPGRRFSGAEKRFNSLLQRMERDADRRLRGLDKAGRYLFHAAQRDFRTTYGSELVRLRPDVIHVHDPRLLPVAFRAAKRISGRTGRSCEVVYDARENFAGVLETQESLPAYHRKVLAAESRFAPRTAAVLTVSDAVADALSERLRLPQKPTVLLNTPVQRPLNGNGDSSRLLRRDAEVGDDVPLLVYPGAASRARGVDTIVRSLPHLPGVHAALVVVPWPHPRHDELMDLAGRLGVADRLHLLPPVEADDVPRYLSAGDVAVHAMLAGIPNHEMAMPNKLFEILHAGLPMAASNVRTMSRFVLEHDMGKVFTSADPADLARVVRELLAERPRGDRRRDDELVRRFSWQGQEAALALAYRRAAAPALTGTDDKFPPAVVAWEE